MSGSTSERQESSAERILCEAPLSFVLLQGLLEVGGGELEDAGLGPVGQQVEQVAQIAPRLEPVQRDRSAMAG